MKLLLAEDEDAMRMAISDVLVFNQYHVTAVSDGEEALKMAQSYYYDVLLLDRILRHSVCRSETSYWMRRRGV